MKPQSLHKETKKYASPASNYGRETPGYKERAKIQSTERKHRLAAEQKAFYKLIFG